jgi:hypothetical protein
VDVSPAILTYFTDAEVERMAELEQGRWNIERLRDRWRSGKTQDELPQDPRLPGLLG